MVLNMKTRINNFFNYRNSSVFIELKFYFLKWKYRKRAYPESLPWNWKDINYNRIALVNLLLARKPEGRYLEIGCFMNDLFDSVPSMNKVGVDPERGGNIRDTSDNFFKNNTQGFDVIFIDGLHLYEQSRKDVINSIRFLNPDGWIALHDMLPRNWLEHHVPDITRPDDHWTGDVWKLAFELSQSEGIDFKIIGIDHGVGVFRITRDNPKLLDLRSELSDKEFGYFFENLHRLPIVRWEECQGWLGS